MASLRVETYNLLIERTKSEKLAKIANDASVSLDWLRSFMKKGLTSTPNVDDVQALYEFLTGTEFSKGIFQPK